VFEEGFEIVPPAPIADEQRIDLLAFQLRRPGPTEVVERQMRPAWVFGFGELLPRGFDPPPQRPGARTFRRGLGGDDGVVVGFVAILGGGLDGVRDRWRNRRFAILVALALADEENGAAVLALDVLRRYVGDLFAAEATPDAELVGELFDFRILGMSMLSSI